MVQTEIKLFIQLIHMIINSVLCLTADSPITKYDGSIVEVGDLEEGDELLGYNPTNLNLDSDDDFFEWNSHRYKWRI